MNEHVKVSLPPHPVDLSDLWAISAISERIGYLVSEVITENALNYITREIRVEFSKRCKIIGFTQYPTTLTLAINDNAYKFHVEHGDEINDVIKVTLLGDRVSSMVEFAEQNAFKTFGA